MSKNPENERVKLAYFDFLKHADGKSEQTIRQVERAISRLENFTAQADFRTFDQRQAMAFKASIRAEGLALATVNSTLNAVQRFLGWLAMQAGYKRAINLSDIEYLNLSEKDVRASRSPSDKQYSTFQMVERAVSLMPSETAIEKRDRAMIVFTAITGTRDGTIPTLKLKHFDPVQKLVRQDPREARTKFSKRIDTFLFPLSAAFEQIFLDWVDYLRDVALFGAGDPLFPKTRLTQDANNCFVADGLSRDCWANAAPIRKVFKTAFRNVDLPEFTPHRFRDMIVSEMYRRGLSVAEFKAWSQNLGHEGAMTTLTSYGKLSIQEQGRLVREGVGVGGNGKIDIAELADMIEKHRSG
tara:strand:+ start:3160 stop:4224 length:1065 start_codon:yes stop_codon:yes gene_type:complete